MTVALLPACSWTVLRRGQHCELGDSMWDQVGTAGVCQFEVSETEESAAGPLSVDSEKIGKIRNIYMLSIKKCVCDCVQKQYFHRKYL